MRSPRVHRAESSLPVPHSKPASSQVGLVVRPARAAGESAPPGAALATVVRRALVPLSPRDRIVCILAPAGYGKTTLSAQWFRDCRAHADPLWIGLDDTWRDPVYFVRSLLAELGASSAAVAMGPMDSASAVRGGLLDLQKLLAQRARPVVFFFDDVHLLFGSESGVVLNQLLLAAPEGVRFVLCSREGMGLDLAALTARGLVRWVTQHELRFTLQDVGALANSRRVAADEVAVDRILELTEGWPALVQLALASGQVALESADSGRDVLMDSFVYESFFRAMSPPRRQALFIMAAVGEFTAALLQALGVPESAEAIVQGEQLGIVQRRGRAADAAYYTLHPLIAERALERFAGAAADRADAVRSSSARWWHARGEIHRAIRTALQGGDARLACGYLASYAPQLVQAEGRHETFLHLLAQVESRGVELNGDLMLQAIWALVFLRRYAQAEVWLERAERACGRARSTAARSIRQRTLLQRGVIAGLCDDAASAELFVQQWLAGPADPDPFHNGAALTVLAYAHKCNARFTDAAQCLRKAQIRFEQAPSPYGLMWVRVISAAALLKAGMYRDALADIDSTLTEAPAFAPGATGLVAMLHAIRAAALYERNQCAEAMVAVELALQLLPHQGIVDAMISGYVTAARLQAARGDMSGAFDVAAEGERVGLARGFVRLQVTMAAERALLLLRSGDVDAAQRMASDHGIEGSQDPQSSLQRDKAERLRARLDLMQGRPEVALGWADSGIARARFSRQQHKLAELLMLRALILQRTGDMDGACDALAESLRIAASQGYVRLYLDEGAAVEHLLRRFVERPRDSSAVVPCARTLLLAFCAASPSAGVPLDQARPTDRELQILRLLAGGMSNSEVAARLMLTEGTVKWHMHNVYGKLGVRNRTGALREARARRLLDV
jgi:LuxR family maltose regulon positive regulatory protein